MAAMASMPPTAPAGNNMRLLPSRAADLSRANSVASASAPTEISRQSIPRRSTASACSATAAWPATSATSAGLRAVRPPSASTMSTPQSFARAASPRPGRASAPTMRTPSAASAPRSAATTSCAMPPQPMRPIAVIWRSLWIEPQAGELPLREFLHGVAHAFAPEAARADAAEGIAVEPEAAGIVDPERADAQLARDLERGFERRGEAGALQAELGGVGERERGVDIGHALHDDHRAECLLAHETRLVRRVGHDRGAENGAAARRLEHESRAFGDRVRDHLLDAVGRGGAHHRPDIGCGILGVADLELPGGGHEQLEEAVEHRLLHDHALRRDALLAAGLEGGAGDAGCRIGEVGVGADNIGRIGAELADELLRAGGAGKLVAGGGAAGDGDDGDKRMGGKELRALAPARHHVEEAVGHARLLDRLSDEQRDLGAGRRGLHHDRIADGERGRDLLDQEISGPVERRDRTDDAIRDARGEAEAARSCRGGIERQHLAHEMRHLRGAGADEGAHTLGLEGGGTLWLADEADERAHELAFDLVDGVGRGQEPFDALGRGRVLMLEERRMRVLDGGLHHLGVGFDDMRGHRIVDRTDQRRESGLELNGPADPRHQLRYGHRLLLTLLSGYIGSNGSFMGLSFPRKREPIITDSGIWVPAFAGTTTTDAAPISQFYPTRAGPR